MTFLVIANDGNEAIVEMSIPLDQRFESVTRIRFARNSMRETSIEQFLRDFPVGKAPAGEVVAVDGE